MPKRSAQYMQDRRNHILDAARKCLAQIGYSQISVANICEAAGVSMGAIYKHFKSKEEIMVALIDKSIQEYQRLEFETLEDLKSFIVDGVLELNQPSRMQSSRVDFELLYITLGDEDLRRHAEKSILAWEDIFHHAIVKLKKRRNVLQSYNVDKGAKALNVMMNGIWLMKLTCPDLVVESYLPVILSVFEGMKEPEEVSGP